MTVAITRLPCNHGRTHIEGAKEATEAEAGYTGDTYCDDCKQMVAQGTIIPPTGGNSGTEKPSPEPGNGGTENPSPTQTVPGKGETLTKGANRYTVTTKGKAVSYAGPVKKNAGSVTIPATVTIGGISYKVTAVVLLPIFPDI